MPDEEFSILTMQLPGKNPFVMVQHLPTGVWGMADEWPSLIMNTRRARVEAERRVLVLRTPISPVIL